jgi:hypothetical protein
LNALKNYTHLNIYWNDVQNGNILRIALVNREKTKEAYNQKGKMWRKWAVPAQFKEW